MAHATLVRSSGGIQGRGIDADGPSTHDRPACEAGLWPPADTTPRGAWEEDGRSCIVAFLGRKLLKRGQPRLQRLQVTYQGPALAVECWGQPRNCNDVDSDAKAGGSLTCHDIQGNANAGGKIACNEWTATSQQAAASDCRSVNGNIAAGGR